MKPVQRPARRNSCLNVLVLGISLVCAWASQATPTILSTVPASMATGVSPTTTIRFTFSEAMNPAATTVMLMDVSTNQTVAASPAWSGGNTILTCTPSAPLAANHMILWQLSGLSAAGAALGGTTAGIFTTAAAGTGCDTNALMLSFTVSKGWMYAQSSTAAPALNPANPYCFLACMSLPCPRDATNVSLQLPGGSVPNLVLAYAGHLTLPDCSYLNQSAFEAAYPYGNYTFNVQAVASNQTVTVNFPSSITQPPAPHLTNYLAAQSINPAQPFVLGWDPLTGGTAADCIYVEIYGGVFHTPNLGSTGALNGTATSVTIPTGTFQPNQSYSGCVTFYHCQLLTNGTSYLSLTYRASTTEFGLHTTSGASSLVLTNAGCVAGAFGFEVTCTNGQALVAEYTTNLASHQWLTLVSTNSPGQRVRFTDSKPATNKQIFYRVRTGS
jgi:methionine-rich copper-binding protein CopC